MSIFWYTLHNIQNMCHLGLLMTACDAQCPWLQSVSYKNLANKAEIETNAQEKAKKKNTPTFKPYARL